MKYSDDIKNQAETERPVFNFASYKDYMSGPLQPTQWLVKKIYEKEALAVLFGPPEGYKSFVALDIGLSIAAGHAWHGHYVTGGSVFSIIGEGANGYRRRIAAWVEARRRNGLTVEEDLPFFISESPAQILDAESAKAVGNAINQMREEHGTPALVIIDTLARNFGPGNENDTRDMTGFIRNLDEYIGRDFFRLIVHHSGLNDSERSRGNSSLRAALDTEFKVNRQGTGVTLSCTKMKDAARFNTLHFEPEIITLGGSEFEPITSVVLNLVEAEKKRIKLSLQMQEALELIADLCAEKVSLPVDDCLQAIKDKKIYTRTAVYSALDKLEDKGLLTITDGYVKLSSLSSLCLRSKQGQGDRLSSVSSVYIDTEDRRQTSGTTFAPQLNTHKTGRREWPGTMYCEVALPGNYEVAI